MLLAGAMCWVLGHLGQSSNNHSRNSILIINSNINIKVKGVKLFRARFTVESWGPKTLVFRVHSGSQKTGCDSVPSPQLQGS